MKASLSHRQIGAIGVFNTVQALFRNGYNVLVPLEDYTGYDIVAEKNGIFKTIQVKTTSKIHKNETRYRFLLAAGSHKKTLYKHKHKHTDYIVCYAADVNKFWLLKTKDCRVISYKKRAESGSDWSILKDI